MMRGKPEAMDLNWERLGQSWSLTAVNWDLEEPHYLGAGLKFGVGDDVSGDDILDRLPADPFGMEIRSTLTAAITGLIQDLDKDFTFDFYGLGKPAGKGSSGVQPLFKGLNCVWNGTIWFQQEKGGFLSDETTTPCAHFNELGVVSGLASSSTCSYNQVVDDANKALGLDDYGVVSSDDDEGGAPHDALFFALGYLGVKDLLNVEKVCKSFRDSVRGDPLLWRNVHIDQPLNMRITDDALVKLAARAAGTVQCLNLVDCRRISDAGLKRVLESNPTIVKLSVPGCTRLTVEGIISNLRRFRLVATPGIKYLRVAGLSGITNKHFQELKFLLGVDEKKQARPERPHYYCGGQLYISCDDDRALDVEICPRCQTPTLVYDCPPGSCCSKNSATQFCRACKLCVPRCVHCGCCIQDCDYEETFCLNFLCLDCLSELFKCRQNQDTPDCSSGGTIFHQHMTYQFCFYG